MEAKHTPGPWKSYVNETTGEGGMPVLAIDQADGQTFRVADVYGIDQDTDHCDISKANVRLIATAPELLKVAHEYLRAYEAHSITNTGGANGADMTGYIADLAREAIAKATQ